MILFCCFLSIRSLVGFGKRYIVQVKKVILSIAAFVWAVLPGIRLCSQFGASFYAEICRQFRAAVFGRHCCFNRVRVSCRCFLENIFHLKLWDYSKHPGNVKGRIAPFISLFWGISTVVLTAFVQPHVMRFVAFLEAKTGMLADLFVIVVMGSDAAITIFNMQKFRAHALVLERMIQIERLRLKMKLSTSLKNAHISNLPVLKARVWPFKSILKNGTKRFCIDSMLHLISMSAGCSKAS